jgi:hypothetical protein
MAFLNPTSRFSKIALILVLLAACSDNDAPTTEDKLKLSLWAGTYRSKGSEIDQPFSIMLTVDNHFQWDDVRQAPRSGTWTTAGDNIVLSFSDGETLTAQVSGDTTWTLLTPSSNENYNLQTVFKVLLKPSLESRLVNNTWEGTTTYPGRESLKLQFGLGQNVTLDNNIKETFQMQGAAVAIYMTNQAHGDTYYFVFSDDTMYGVWELGDDLYVCRGKKK